MECYSYVEYYICGIYGVLLSHKIQILPIAMSWINLEGIMASETGQTEGA